MQGGIGDVMEQKMLVEDNLSYPIELHFSCTKLAKMDLTSKSDPFLVLYMQNKNKY